MGKTIKMSLKDILNMAAEIDAGLYIGEIEEPVIPTIRNRKTTPQSPKRPEDMSDDTESR